MKVLGRSRLYYHRRMWHEDYMGFGWIIKSASGRGCIGQRMPATLSSCTLETGSRLEQR